MALHSHVLLMALFAALLAVVAATLLKDTVKEQVRSAAKIFGVLLAGAIAFGWVLYLFPL